MRTQPYRQEVQANPSFYVRTLGRHFPVVALCMLIGGVPWLLHDRLVSLRDQAARQVEDMRLEQERQTWLEALPTQDMPSAPLLPQQIAGLTRSMTMAELDQLVHQAAQGMEHSVIDVTPHHATGRQGDGYSEVSLSLSGGVGRVQDIADVVERLRRSVVGRVAVTSVALSRQSLEQGSGGLVQLEARVFVNKLAEGEGVTEQEVGAVREGQGAGGGLMTAPPPLPSFLRLDSILSYPDGRWVVMTNWGQWHGQSGQPRLAADPSLDIDGVADDAVRFVWHGDAVGRSYAFTLHPRQTYHVATGRIE